jgi:hypothetical protein
MGYSFCPTEPASKKPAIRDWSSLGHRVPNSITLAKWQKKFSDFGVGLVGGRVVAIDIDAMDPILANQMEAEVRCVAAGDPLVRVGQWPKKVLLYRNLEPIASSHGEAAGLANTNGVDPASAPPSSAPAAPSSVWTARTQTDPMSDKVIASATAQLVADPWMIEAVVTCHGGDELTYQFTAFDQNGQAANFRRTIHPQPHYSEDADISVRLDNASARPFTDYDLRYSNAVSFSSRDIVLNEVSLPERAAPANRMTVQLELEAGRPVLVVDQTDPAIRGVVQACSAGLLRMRRRVEERKVADHKACLARQATQLAQAKESSGMAGDTYGQSTPYESCS